MANQLATIKTEVFDKVQAVVKNYTNSGELALPEGYSPDNAMKSAWLVLQEAVDTNKRPVLESLRFRGRISAQCTWHAW